MVRIAEALAGERSALALATGESLGQVASQTLESIARIDEAATLPILRPLIGMDKLEITAEAQRLGTFEVSIEPDADCCTRSEEHTSELQSLAYLVCRLLLEKKKKRSR